MTAPLQQNIYFTTWCTYTRNYPRVSRGSKWFGSSYPCSCLHVRMCFRLLVLELVGILWPWKGQKVSHFTTRCTYTQNYPGVSRGSKWLVSSYPCSWLHVRMYFRLGQWIFNDPWVTREYLFHYTINIHVTGHDGWMGIKFYPFIWMGGWMGMSNILVLSIIS